MVRNLNRCRATKKDGTPCPAPALTDGGLCYAHDPECAAERKAARARGGRNRSNLVRLRNLGPPRLVPIYNKLEDALEEVHKGTLSPQQATAMAAVARALAALLQAGELEQRVRELEQGVIPTQDWRVR